MRPQRIWLWLLGSYLLLVVIGLWVRPLLPVDETRYATVAWEMWTRGDYLLPHLNGEPYDHKPPLLFWLIAAGWWVLGTDSAWVRGLGPLLTLVNVFLLARLAERLWPDRPPVRWLAPVVFLGGWYIALYSTALMFDMLLLAFVLGAWLAIWRAAAQPRLAHFVAIGACVGLGMLAKGPVALVYTLPLALLAPWWHIQSGTFARRRWYLGVAIAVAIAIAIPVAWLASIAATADTAYLWRVIWEQTAGRISGEMGHGRPIWWYLPLLPIVALPWIAWPPAWRAVASAGAAPAESGSRFAVAGAATSFVVLSLVGGKQAHYLLPILALASAFLARRLADMAQARPPTTFDDLPIAILMSPLPMLLALVWAARNGQSVPAWVSTISIPLALLPALVGLTLIARENRGIVRATVGVGVAGLQFAALTLLAVMQVARPYYDLESAARFIGEQQQSGRPIAFVGARYQGEFGYFGRLREPIETLEEGAVDAWAEEHPDGFLVARRKRLAGDSGLRVAWSQPYKSDELLIFGAVEVSEGRVAFREVSEQTSGPKGARERDGR
ncbi:MAG TPA: glycosyltransferase family 39 protein [Pseudomonadota bacterium]|nr:glycosyltransferase family 39 protein [Pseudomonadota bacterium]HQY36914.1 glycosyltransferase family 39 protein [Pseudomonadota bacterium]